MQTDKQTDFANQGDTISKQAAIEAINTWDKFGVDERSRVVRWCEGLEPYVRLRDVVTSIAKLPSAQTEPISEEYAKAVECWLMTYQIKCAELRGRYTPYEILGWIVSDWRKENEIWRFNRQTGGD